jgi:cytochrome c oxidase accessory protein FixG
MIISRPVDGKIRKMRTIVQGFLLGLFFISPWIKLPSGVPLIQLDIPGRKFHLMGNFYIPQEGLILFLFLLTMGLSLFFFTSLIGRVWCGWACPQTVYTDLFDFFGRLILGKKYGKKDASKPKVAIVHAIWIVVSFVACFHWIGYFASPYEMIEGLSSFDFKGQLYPYFLAAFTVAMYVDMGFVREQFCKYGCPYARFQTIMMDEHSYNITYDYKRGEPRRNKQTKIGDCTSCNMCLVVCPTGIDIREGLQIGCIACGKCADACTIQMAKENKKTLIDYFSLAQIDNNEKIKWVRPRTIIYGVLLTAVVSFSIYKLYTRIPLSVMITPDRTIEPAIIDGSQLRHIYKLKMYNISNDQQDLKLTAVTYDNRELVIRSEKEDNIVNLESAQIKDDRVIIELPLSEKDKGMRSIPVIFKVQDMKNPKIIVEKKIPLSLPLSK